MNLTIKNVDSAVIFQLDGKLVSERRETIRSICTLIEESDSDKFFVDLSNAEFIDSACVGSLISVYRTALAKNAGFAVIESEGMVSRSLKTVGVHLLFKLFKSEEDALQAA